jgi:hypothetical protein
MLDQLGRIGDVEVETEHADPHGAATLTVAAPGEPPRRNGRATPVRRIHAAGALARNLPAMPSVILLPYHQDERLVDRSIGLPGGIAPAMVDPRLPDADQWTRLVALYDALATRVADDASSGVLTRVVTGDCLATLGALVGLQRAGLDPALVWFDATATCTPFSRRRPAISAAWP